MNRRAIRLSLAAEKRLEQQPSAYFNSRLVDAMLACFPQCVFDGSGQPRPLYAFSSTASHSGTDKSTEDVIETLFGPYSVGRLSRERRIDYPG